MDRVRIFGAKYRYMARRLPATVRVFLASPRSASTQRTGHSWTDLRDSADEDQFPLGPASSLWCAGRKRRAGSSRMAHRKGSSKKKKASGKEHGKLPDDAQHASSLASARASNILSSTADVRMGHINCTFRAGLRYLR